MQLSEMWTSLFFLCCCLLCTLLMSFKDIFHVFGKGDLSDSFFLLLGWGFLFLCFLFGWGFLQCCSETTDDTIFGKSARTHPDSLLELMQHLLHFLYHSKHWTYISYKRNNMLSFFLKSSCTILFLFQISILLIFTVILSLLSLRI